MPVAFKSISNLYEAEEYARGSATAAATKCPVATTLYQAAAASIKSSPYYLSPFQDPSVVAWAKSLISAVDPICKANVVTSGTSSGSGSSSGSGGAGSTKPVLSTTGNPLEPSTGSNYAWLWLGAAVVVGLIVHDQTKKRAKRKAARAR